jgi:hypothetical protein
MAKEVNRQTPPHYYPGIDDPLPWHPYACLLPESSDTELEELVRSIRQVGQLDPVIVYQGQILDGRHREQAIAEINRQNQVEGKDTLKLIYGYFQEGKTGPDIDYLALSMVEAKNLCRRDLNLTVSQRAAIAVKFEEEFVRIAKAESDLRKGDGSLAPVRGDEKDNYSSHKAAKKANVSPRSVQMAKAVKKSNPELFQDVADGKLPVKTAYNQIKPHSPKEKEPEQQLLPLPDPQKIEIDLESILIGFTSNIKYFSENQLTLVLSRILEERPEVWEKFLNLTTPV